MPPRCFVPGCNSGYDSEKGRVAGFHPPQGKLELWNKAIPRADISLSYKDFVCEKHFEPEEVLSKFIFKFPDGSVYEDNRMRKTLREGAVPHIFPNLPKYLSFTKTKRKSPTKRTLGKPGKKTSVRVTNPLVNSIKFKSLPTLLHEALSDPAIVKLPTNWKYIEDKDIISFVHSSTGDIINIDKIVTFRKYEQGSQPLSQQPTITLNGVMINNIVRNIRTKEDLENFTKYVDKMKTCPGSGIDNRKHKDCEQVVCRSFKSIISRCKMCQQERKRLVRSKIRIIKAKQRKQKKLKSKRAQVYRKNKQIITLKNEIGSLKEKMNSMKKEAIKKVLDSVTEEKHREVIETIIMESNCTDNKNRRYSNDWMYECILMRIKSPALYRKMLRDNLLPLPSCRTIQRFIKKLQPQFGFDEHTFKLMHEKSKHLEESERHGKRTEFCLKLLNRVDSELLCPSFIAIVK